MQRLSILHLCGAALIAWSGCSKKVDVHHEASELEKAFPDSQSSPYVGLALSAVRTNDYATGVIALQNARRLPGISADQLMAVQQTLEAITADLVSRADR